MPTDRQKMRNAGFVLIVEDNVELAQTVGQYLDQRGYAVDYAHDGTTGLRLAADQRYDAIILDKGLPGLDGMTVCRRLRAEYRNTTPIVMLTGHTSLEDKLQALDGGADDYICKPFDLRELGARLSVLIRRGQGKTVQDVLAVGDLTFDTGTLEVVRAGQPIDIGPVPLRILEVLMRESPRVVSRERLERQIWGESLPDSDTLRSHLYILRRAMDKPFDYPLLHTLPFVGYRLADVREGVIEAS
jgi:DNA-binding response OmpR family regulator